MSSRERISHQPEWDPDADAAPPVWHGRPASAQGNGGPVSPSDDLPNWSRRESGDDRLADDSYPTLPPRSRRTTPVSSDRRGTAWPNLRDSLKGSATATAGTRGGRRPTPSPPPPSNSTRTASYPIADRYDDDLPWPIPDDAPFEPAGGGIDEPRVPVRRGAAGRTRPRPRRAAPGPSRPSLQLPATLATVAAAQDRAVLTALGGSALSLFFMVITVSSRSDSLPPWIAIHLNAAGSADRWGTASTVWRLPLMTAMLTLASFVGALCVARRDPFASKFLLVSVLLIHALAWVGLVRILW